MLKKIVLFVLLAAITYSADSSPKINFFALMNPGDRKADFEYFASIKEIDGLAVRLKWDQIEPREGEYDWSILDSAISSAQKNKKRITLHIGVSAGGTPLWLMDYQPKTYKFQTRFHNGINILPWDNQLIEKYTRLISTAGKHIKDKGFGTVTAVSVGAPISEMSIPECQNGWIGEYQYDRELYLKGWQYTIHATATAFPKSTLFISAPVWTICRPDRDGATFYAELMDYASKIHPFPTIFVADLTAKGSQRFTNLSLNIQKRYPLGMQTMWSSKDDPNGRMKGNMTDALCEGLKNRAHYFEIYQKDIKDPTIMKSINAVKSGACDKK